MTPRMHCQYSHCVTLSVEHSRNRCCIPTAHLQLRCRLLGMRRRMETARCERCSVYRIDRKTCQKHRHKQSDFPKLIRINVNEASGSPRPKNLGNRWHAILTKIRGADKRLVCSLRRLAAANHCAASLCRNSESACHCTPFPQTLTAEV